MKRAFLSFLACVLFSYSVFGIINSLKMSEFVAIGIIIIFVYFLSPLILIKPISIVKFIAMVLANFGWVIAIRIIAALMTGGVIESGIKVIIIMLCTFLVFIAISTYIAFKIDKNYGYFILLFTLQNIMMQLKDLGVHVIMQLRDLRVEYDAIAFEIWSAVDTTSTIALVLHNLIAHITFGFLIFHLSKRIYNWYLAKAGRSELLR